MKEYIARGWDQILSRNKLDHFDAIWNLEAGWFEEPNKRRGGWSGVSRINIQTKLGTTVGVFLKRQENHNTKVWTNPFKGVPTFYKEFKNILNFVAHDVPTVEPVYFAYRYEKGKTQAILMTKELEGFNSLDSVDYVGNSALMQNPSNRGQLISSVAEAIRKMHGHGYQHNCLYGKHIFVRPAGKKWEVKFIDLEKLSRIFFKKKAMKRDLYTLPRHISGWRRNDRVKFLKNYMQEDKLSPRSKLLWREIHRRMQVKKQISALK